MSQSSRINIISQSNDGVQGKDYLHFPLGTIIKLPYSSLPDNNHYAFAHGVDVRLSGIAGMWRLYKRHAISYELKRVSHGDWCIGFQWRRDIPLPGANPNKWQSWRHFSAYPMRFSSLKECEDYLLHVMHKTFQNLGNKRKASASAYNRHVLAHNSRISAGLKK